MNNKTLLLGAVFGKKIDYIPPDEDVKQVLDKLTPREQEVLKLRLGLDDGRSRTLKEIGQSQNVTKERIRQIEAKALRKLRHPSKARVLWPDYYYV